MNSPPDNDRAPLASTGEARGSGSVGTVGCGDDVSQSACNRKRWMALAVEYLHSGRPSLRRIAAEYLAREAVHELQRLEAGE